MPYTVNDIVTFAINDEPLNVQKAVDDVMLDKVGTAIQDKKIEIAKNAFVPRSETDPVDVPGITDLSLGAS
jgi:hypothetical protein